MTPLKYQAILKQKCKQTADASNSKQKLQHWIKKNQINKKNKSSSIKSFFHQVQRHFSGKSQGREKKKEWKYTGRKTWKGHAQQDLGRGSAGQTW